MEISRAQLRRIHNDFVDDYAYEDSNVLTVTVRARQGEPYLQVNVSHNHPGNLPAEYDGLRVEVITLARPPEA